MTEQEILDNAPEGWTHFNPSLNKYYTKEHYKHGLMLPVETRSRKDIERIAELEIQLKAVIECSDRNDANNFDLLALASKENEILKNQINSELKSIAKIKTDAINDFAKAYVESRDIRFDDFVSQYIKSLIE